MAKLRETSVQNELSIVPITNEEGDQIVLKNNNGDVNISSNNLTVTDDGLSLLSGDGSVNFKNANGNVNITSNNLQVSNDSLSLSNGSGQYRTSVNFKNNNGDLEINFVRHTGSIPSLNVTTSNVNIGNASGINTSNNSIDIFKPYNNPNVTTKTVSMQDRDGPVTRYLVPENTSNTISSSIGINEYNKDGSYYP